MAIGWSALRGLLAFGAIYQIGSWSQETSRAIAGNARAISDLNKQLADRDAGSTARLRRIFNFAVTWRIRNIMPNCRPRLNATFGS